MPLKSIMLLTIPICTFEESKNGAQYAMVGIYVVNALPLELNLMRFASFVESVVMSQDIF